MTALLPDLPSPWLAALAFGLAAVAVIGNDAVQTLGPFLSSNRDRTPRWLQGLFFGGLLVLVLLLGWWRGGGDPSWGRLATFPAVVSLAWIDLLPSLAVLALTAWGAPVSTTVLLLAAVVPAQATDLVLRSLLGYGLALAVALPVYLLLADRWEPPPVSGPEPAWWMPLQWLATGWLWTQWLIQDLANIYVMLPRRLDPLPLGLSLGALLLALALLLWRRGGSVQAVVDSKSNSRDRRSATLIDLVYGLILFGLGRWSPRPLSTTWVFLGLLAGRELALGWCRRPTPWPQLWRTLATDLAKAGAGLALSVVLVLVMAGGGQLTFGHDAGEVVVPEVQ